MGTQIRSPIESEIAGGRICMDKNKKASERGTTEDLFFYSLWKKNRYLIEKIVRRFSFSTTDIEDISQETLLRALEARHKTEIRHPRQFIISIAKNVAREEIRRRARKIDELVEESELENHQLDEPTAEAALDARDKLRLFVQAISNLPPQCRRVFLLKHVQGAAHKEIAARLGISVSTVEKHVAAGMKACRREMLNALNDPSAENEVQYIFDESQDSK